MEELKEVDESKELLARLTNLESLFKEKIQTDEYKNSLFDEMHRQLKEYQEDVILSAVNPIVLEIIDILERMKLQYSYIPEEVTSENYQNLQKKFRDIIGDLEDLLTVLDVDIYSVEGSIPDSKRQKIVKTVSTGEKAMDNTLEKKISNGYIRQNKIIKYEKISIYKYQGEESSGNE